MKIILAGPPQSGKSCLRFGLKEALKSLGDQCPYPHFLTACPDGEGAWFHETAANNPENAAKLKKEQKREFNPQLTQHLAQEVRTCSSELTLIDIGGVPSPENEIICAGARHAILIAAKPSDLVPWQQFCQKLSLSIFAEIESDYHGSHDRPLEQGRDQVYRGSIHYLERGELSLPEKPTIQQLAQSIAKQFPAP